MSFSNAGFQVPLSPCRVRAAGTAHTSTVTPFKLVEDSASFDTACQIGDRVLNTSDSTFATVLDVESATVLRLDADIFTANSKNYRVLRPSFEPLHPGLGVEMAYSSVIVRGHGVGGDSADGYTVDLVMIDPQSGRKTLIARSDANGVLVNAIEIAKNDGSGDDTAIMPITLMPSFHNMYRIENYRLETVLAVGMGIDKSLTVQ